MDRILKRSSTSETVRWRWKLMYRLLSRAQEYKDKTMLCSCPHSTKHQYDCAEWKLTWTARLESYDEVSRKKRFQTGFFGYSSGSPRIAWNWTSWEVDLDVSTDCSKPLKHLLIFQILRWPEQWKVACVGSLAEAKLFVATNQHKKFNHLLQKL